MQAHLAFKILKIRYCKTDLVLILYRYQFCVFFQALLCNNAPIFPVHMLRFSLTGKYLALVGQKGITVIEMPQRWGRFAEYQGGANTISCRYVKDDDDDNLSDSDNHDGN